MERSESRHSEEFLQLEKRIFYSFNFQVQRCHAASSRRVLCHDGFGHANNKRAYFQFRLSLR